MKPLIPLQLDSARRNTLRAFSLLPASIALSSFAQAKLPRIVSVSGSTTEIVYALGAETQLVGTDTTSLFPAAALQTAKVGYQRQLSAEGVMSLRPDAVIGTTEAGPPVVLDQIRSAGVKVDLVEADHSWAEVQRKVTAVGRATARAAEASALQARLDAQWAGVQAAVAKAAGSGPQAPRVMFILSHSANASVSGDKTAAHAMMTFAGLNNVMASFGKPASYSGYRPMTAEAMVVAAPDIIITTVQGIEASGGVDKFWAKAGLDLTPAYKKRSLVALDALYLMGFGPRLPQAVAELHRQAFKAAGRLTA